MLHPVEYLWIIPTLLNTAAQCTTQKISVRADYVYKDKNRQLQTPNKHSSLKQLIEVAAVFYEDVNTERQACQPATLKTL